MIAQQPTMDEGHEIAQQASQEKGTEQQRKDLAQDQQEG